MYPPLNEDRFERHGECRRCGGCCDSNCQYIIWTAMRDIKAGERIRFGTDQGAMFSTCTLFYSTEVGRGCTKDVRDGFPFSPFSTPNGCGFSWTAVSTDGN